MLIIHGERQRDLLVGERDMHGERQRDLLVGEREREMHELGNGICHSF